MSAQSLHNARNVTSGDPRVVGMLAEVSSPGALLSAAQRVRDAGYTRWDTHSPFPVHGIDEAMGIRRTRLPWVVFLVGAAGCVLGLLLVYWTNATSSTDFPGLPAFLQGYDYFASGKPLFSLPANIPVIFEMTVLMAALAAVVGMLAMNNLPRHYNPLFGMERFRRVTADRFFVFIDARDPRFDPVQTRALLASLDGAVVEEVRDAADSPTALPRGLVITLMVVVSVLLLPPLLAARARVSKSSQPRIHIIQDMDNQERFKAQQPHSLFADLRAQRPPVAGTIARGDLREDTHHFEGRLGDAFATTFPPQLLPMTEDFVQRGRKRFNVYCAPCHGLGGAGDGVVTVRASQRIADESQAAQKRGETYATGWVKATSLIEPKVVEMPVGQMFHTITAGARTMPPYGDQIPVEDRWAIVSYILALQRSQRATLDDVPAEQRTLLETR